MLETIRSCFNQPSSMQNSIFYILITISQLSAIYCGCQVDKTDPTFAQTAPWSWINQLWFRHGLFLSSRWSTVQGSGYGWNRTGNIGQLHWDSSSGGRTSSAAASFGFYFRKLGTVDLAAGFPFHRSDAYDVKEKTTRRFRRCFNASSRRWWPSRVMGERHMAHRVKPVENSPL